jgi:hypothetical protein
VTEVSLPKSRRQSFWRRGDRSAEPVELAALADASLPADRRNALASRVGASPGLRSLLAEQERALAFVRAAEAAVGAPARLRARIEAERPFRPTHPRRALGFGAGVVVATATAVLLLLLSPAPGGGPSVAAAAELSTLAATAPAPTQEPGEPGLLERAVGDVYFPSWKQNFGWRAGGVRTDTFAERAATTVFYEKGGRRLGYTILDGSPLTVPRDAVEVHRNGTELYEFVTGGHRVVTWLRDGRTCVLSGDGIGQKVLLKLAAWSGGGAVSS